ncbi:ISAzo13 family transposase [Streptomyces sp. NPDC056831]|uniref:ISAzo13 family transposase n=1 Tax=Streptomyces sp. NPDC056831 TaxID=3345954 RepID=UPI00367CDB26
MRISSEVCSQLALRFAVLFPHLNERQRRLALATEARLLGHGGVRAVARTADVSETTVRKGVFELEAGEAPLPEARIRRSGGGRKSAEELDPLLVPALMALVEPDERGDPMSPLRWTTKSLRHLAEELSRQGHRVSAPTVGRLLRESGFSLQGTAKTVEGKQHPDRDAQFRYINEQVKQHQAAGEPVISVDGKKKEQLGLLPNAGREWRPAGDPVRVEDHSFFTVGADVEQAIPYGIYDITADTGWVNVGVDHDTSAFAVASIRRWWEARGAGDYPHATRLLITADAGGSNSYRFRLWKAELAALAADAGLTITVCHFPPGTSKWNKIEHRLFSHITMNWRGRPLTSHEVVVNTITATRTRTGLRVEAKLDTAAYPVGISVTREQMKALPIEAHPQHGTWNYSIRPTGAGAEAPVRASEREQVRAQTLTMLADPRLTGMDADELARLAEQLAPAQASQAEQRRYQQRGGRRVRAPGTFGRPLLTDTERLLITVVYLRQVCFQKVLVELLGISSVSISRMIADTRLALDKHRITITPTTLCFSRAQELRDYLDDAQADVRPDLSPDLSDPCLTGMSRADLQAMVEKLALPYEAALEQRRRHQRGRDRVTGSRGGGVFIQKISDADRILVTVLLERKLCSQQVLADLFNVSRGTIRAAMLDVLPLMKQYGYAIAPADQYLETAVDLLASVIPNKTRSSRPGKATC